MLTFVTAHEMDNFDCTKINAQIHSLSMGGAHSQVEAYIARPTSSPYAGKQLTVLFHTQPLFTTLVDRCVEPMITCVF